MSAANANNRCSATINQTLKTGFPVRQKHTCTSSNCNGGIAPVFFPGDRCIIFSMVRLSRYNSDAFTHCKRRMLQIRWETVELCHGSRHTKHCIRTSCSPWICGGLLTPNFLMDEQTLVFASHCSFFPVCVFCGPTCMAANSFGKNCMDTHAWCWCSLLMESLLVEAGCWQKTTINFTKWQLFWKLVWLGFVVLFGCISADVFCQWILPLSVKTRNGVTHKSHWNWRNGFQNKKTQKPHFHYHFSFIIPWERRFATADEPFLRKEMRNAFQASKTFPIHAITICALHCRWQVITKSLVLPRFIAKYGIHTTAEQSSITLQRHLKWDAHNSRFLKNWM